LDVRCFETKRRILIEDVYVVPYILCSLLSVKALCRKGIVTVFAEKEVVFKKGNRTVISGELRNQLFVVVFEEEKQANVMQMNKALVWHRRFAHCLREKLRVLKGIYPELPRDLPLTFDCKDC
jgi:retron-type reverse transcriptase